MGHPVLPLELLSKVLESLLQQFHMLQGGLAALQTIMEEILRESLTSPAPCPVSGRLLELGQRATHNITEWKKKKAKIEESGVDLIMVEVAKRD